MNRVYLLIVLLLTSGVTLAQSTQQGIVKTRGRMINGQLQPGKGLQGTTVQTADRSVVSNASGTFSFPLREKTYMIKEVKKQGYQLVDMEQCRSHQYSADPLYLVMETPEQQRSDLLAAEKKIRRNLQRQLQKREDAIEALNASIEEKDSLLRILYQQQGDNEKLIADMAKRYSTLDYDQLDEFYRQVNNYIEEGQLTRADSLLRTRGDINAQVQAILQNGQAIEAQKRQLQQAETVHAADIDEATRRCHGYYETFFAQHQNDSAAYYLELRAALDTTNVQWQNDAGRFIEEYLADYTKALSYHQRVLRQALQQYGEQSEWVAIAYHNISSVYSSLGDYAKALEYYQQALVISKTVLGESHPYVATSYDNIGTVYTHQGDYAKALEYLQQALAIRKTVLGESHQDVATSYNNIGYVYSIQGNYAKALEYFQRALDIQKAVLGENHPDVATSYNHIGFMYNRWGDYAKALEYYQQALDIQKAVFGEDHPDVATCYNNIGGVYYKQGNYAKALEYYQQALAIRKTVLGESHQDVATSYNNIGYVYSIQGNYAKALEYFQRALDIQKAVLGENHPDVATSYNHIGFMYNRWGDYAKALEYYQQALDIQKAVFGEDHPDVATCYNNIGGVYYKQGNYAKALEYYQQALAIIKAVLGEDHPNVATSYNKIGGVYYNQGDYAKALEYLRQALTIQKTVLGENHINTQNTQTTISYALYKQALSTGKIGDFLQTHCFTATIIDGETPAKQQGMSGEYIILEIADWNQNSPTSLFDKNEELRGKPKDILMMKDGVISQHHFENAIGVVLGIKEVSKEEKQRINKAYEEWKRQNRQ